MNEDHSFRLVLLLWAVSLMLIAAYHRLRAHTGEKLDHRQAGIFILVTLRLAGVWQVGSGGLCAEQRVLHPFGRWMNRER